jgi:hypothetical protein
VVDVADAVATMALTEARGQPSVKFRMRSEITISVGMNPRLVEVAEVCEVEAATALPPKFS